MKKIGIVTTLACSIVPLSAWAGDLKAPFELETSQVLPRGVRNPRFKNLFMSVETKFNDAGGSEGLGEKLNKVVSWGDILDAQETPEKKAQVQGLIQSAGLAGTSGPGATTGVVNTSASIMVPVLAMGVTDRLTLAVAVPVINVDVKTSTGFVKNGNGQAFVNAAYDGSGPLKGEEAANKLNDAINQKLTRLGYEPIHDMTVSGIGDVKLVGKYNLYNDEVQSISAKADVTFPTGKKPIVNRALDVPTGDGQYDLGGGVSYDRMLLTDLRWNTYGSYTWQIADKLERRLPVSVDDSLSSDQELVNRDLGDQITMGTSLNYYFPSFGTTLGAGYSFQYQTRTTFSGTRFAEERYRWLSDLYPLQSLHSTTMTAGFSTVDWYKQKKFFYPFQANVAYSHPLAGRNVTKNDVLAAELVLFF